MNKIFITAVLAAISCNVYAAGGIDSASFYYKKAKQLALSNKVWEADKSFQTAIKFNSTDEVRLAYGDFLNEQHKFFQAVDQYGKVLEGNLNNVVALEKMARISFDLKRWNDVVMYGNKLLQNGNAKDLKYLIGRSYYEMENYGQSQKYLNVALQEDPRHLPSVTLLGKVLVEMSNYKQAIDVYARTLELDPNNSQLIYEMGLLYYTINDEKNSVAFFEQAAQKGYKTDLDYYENLGLAYLSIDIKKGVENLNKVLVKKPGNSEILFQIAQAYYKVERFQDAADNYYKVYEGDPTNVRALYMTGVAYQKKGDKSKGVLLCDKAISLDPELAQLKTQKMNF